MEEPESVVAGAFRSEAERQLKEAAARHRELIATSLQSGRSPAGDSSAAAALTRGAALVTYALRRAVAAGIEGERLAELSGWEPDVVELAVQRGPGPVLPPDLDPAAVTRSEATLDAMAKLDELFRRMSSDLTDPAWSPAPVDLDELGDRLEQEWREWRRRLGQTR